MSLEDFDSCVILFFAEGFFELLLDLFDACFDIHEMVEEHVEAVSEFLVEGDSCELFERGI